MALALDFRSFSTVLERMVSSRAMEFLLCTIKQSAIRTHPYLADDIKHRHTHDSHSKEDVEHILLAHLFLDGRMMRAVGVKEAMTITTRGASRNSITRMAKIRQGIR